MSLEQLAHRALDNRHLDPETALRIRRRLDRAPFLTAEEYEALRRLGAALRSGEVARGV
ncbi:MAG: hypothetical protein ACYDA8_18105 [Deferrisomatales bacterium]